MASEEFPLMGPDLALGVPSSDVKDGEILLGHAFGEPMILVRRGSELFAVGAVCTHWNGPLAEGRRQGISGSTGASRRSYSRRTTA